MSFLTKTIKYKLGTYNVTEIDVEKPNTYNQNDTFLILNDHYIIANSKFGESVINDDNLSFCALCVENLKKTPETRQYFSNDNIVVFVYTKTDEYILGRVTDYDFGDETVAEINLGVKFKTNKLDINYDYLCLNGVNNVISPYLENSWGEVSRIETYNVSEISLPGITIVSDKLSVIDKVELDKSLFTDFDYREFVSMPFEVKIEYTVNEVTNKVTILGCMTAFRGEHLIKSNEKTAENITFNTTDIEYVFVATNDVDKKANFANADIDFLANAVFEIDEKLLQLEGQIPALKVKLFKNLEGVSFMAEMWARWIQTGRRRFDQCPAQYQEEVRKLLSDVGLDENGKPIK